MINEIRLKKTVNDILRETFPTAHIYGQGDNEGFEYPAIFSEMALTNQNDATINIVEKNYKIGIQYVPSGDRSEEDDLTFYQTLRDALCCIDDRNRKRKMCIKVLDDDDNSDRYIKVKDLAYGYVGEAQDQMIITFTLYFHDFKEYAAPEPLITDVDVDVELKSRR